MAGSLSDRPVYARRDVAVSPRRAEWRGGPTYQSDLSREATPVPPSETEPRRHGALARIGLIAWQAARALVAHEGFEFSGYAAFTAILSLFPFLVFLAALGGVLGESATANQLITSAFDYVPRAVADVLAPVIREVLSHQRPELLTLGIIFSVWSASSGVEALRTLLNRSYQVIETRPVWRLRLQSIAVVVVGALLALLLSLIIVLGPLLLAIIRYVFTIAAVSAWLWFGVRYLCAGLLGTLLLTTLHFVLPNCSFRLREILPGAFVTTVLWLAGAGLFAVYVDNFSQFAVTYGSLGGIILTLLFFYLDALMFVYGAELNGILLRRAARQTGKDGTVDPLARQP
jgi:membrane protein